MNCYIASALVVLLTLFAFNSALDQVSDAVEPSISYCSELEPCKFGFLIQKGGSRHLGYKKIDTWCQCRDDQLCRNGGYDERRRINIYYCRDAGSRSAASRRRMAFKL